MELKTALDEVLAPAAVEVIMNGINSRVNLSGINSKGAAAADTSRLKGDLQQKKQIQK